MIHYTIQENKILSEATIDSISYALAVEMHNVR